MTITLAPENEEKLRETALREGQDADALANAMLAETLSQREQDFMAEVAAIQEGLDAVDQGRVRSFKEFIDEHRAKYPDLGRGE